VSTLDHKERIIQADKLLQVRFPLLLSQAC